MNAILGKKLGMTRLHSEQGSSTPVTVVKAGPCWVTQIKTKENEGRDAIQIGFGKTKNLPKPLQGHLAKLKPKLDREPNFKYLKEFEVEDVSQYQLGDKIDVTEFEEKSKVKVTGVCKSKGFQGVVKRHNFSGGPATHGTKDTHRTPGAIGSAYPQRVRKGQKMPGRMGGKKTTISNLEVVSIDPEKNILNIKGGLPGNDGDLVIIKKQ